MSPKQLSALQTIAKCKTAKPNWLYVLTVFPIGGFQMATKKKRSQRMIVHLNKFKTINKISCHCNHEYSTALCYVVSFKFASISMS